MTAANMRLPIQHLLSAIIFATALYSEHQYNSVDVRN